MAKKMSKTLLSTLLCATLVVGTAMTVCAAESECSHKNYIVENEWSTYTDGFNDDCHWCFDWEERYCLDCGAYFEELVNTDIDDHAFVEDVCVYCGHERDE